VKLQVKNTSNNSAVASKTGTFTSKRLEHSYYYGYEVLFDSPADLKKNTRYEIEARISGPDSRVGVAGLKTVQRSGVTFTFLTNENEGQFPEFLFSVL